MSKLIAEADRLLEKGKIPEALEKLKAAQKAEPLNQLIATKLANVYLDNEETGKAVKVFVALADRLSEAGKAQVAIAIYKQALELDPTNISLKVVFATECEVGGKLSDAQTHASFALTHYLHRKKYFDAANLMPMLVRIQGKDEKLKETWIEILQLSQADQKLIHLLVALCGPPGLVSQEFSVGGDPAALSPALYEALKGLVPYFPRDPKLAYALAWSALRRGNLGDFYRYLRECLRRDPDFCLALLLFARSLAEQKKADEAFFIFKHLKERMMADKSVEMVTLNRLVDDFVEKNSWINFNDSEVLDAGAFLGAISKIVSPNVSAPAAAASPAPPIPASVPPPIPKAALPSVELPQSPLDLFASPLNSVAVDPPKLVVPPAAPAVPPSEEDGVETGSPTSIITKGADTGPAGDIELGSGGSSEMEVEHTSATRIFKPSTPVISSEKEVLAAAPESPPVPEDILAPPASKEAKPEERNTSPKIIFNPFESSAPKIIEEENFKPALEAGEKTEMFSPMDLLGASDRRQAGGVQVETKLTLERPEDLAEIGSPRGDLPVFDPSPQEPAMASETVEPPIEGPATEIFSPMEHVDAGLASRRPMGSGLRQEGGGEEQPLELEKAYPKKKTIEPKNPPAFELPKAPTENPISMAPKGLVPMPEPQALSGTGLPDAASEIDLGDDLLNDPTRILVVKNLPEPTTNLARELAEDLGGKGAVDTETLLRKSERYIAKRNYYMARKILRHVLAIGGDEAKIKERLRDIRKLELPDGLYNTISSDESESKEASDEILDRLEQEFDLRPHDSGEAEDLVSNIDLQLENIFRENDPRTILDFGVALHEMGLFRQAEKVFARLVDEFPETAFDAYYLAAVSKYARKDYAGAASILKTLSADGGKTELEKIQVYYALGELFEKMERPDSSKEFFKKVAELDANYRNIRHKLEE